uniref:F-box domain-containing protein n=1 Tax=Oryza punctata TaxID=4537 RepID=A0A0E0M790_ORYPU
MGSSPAAAAAVEELTRLYRELPRRPSAEEVEAAAAVLASAEAEDAAARLAQVEVAAPQPPEDGVPGEILDVLREAWDNAVPPIGLLRRRKEAEIVVEVDRRFKVFDELLARLSRVVATLSEPPAAEAGEERVDSAPVPTAPAELVEEAVRRTPRGFTGGLDDEMVLCEILVRLPARSILRCRAVCTSWRRLTSDPAFLRAHHRRQPDLPLIYFRRGDSDYVGAIDLHAAQLRPVIDYTWPFGYTVIASCDGLLLLSSGRFYICNPATNHWAEIPQLVDGDFLGLYPHSLSGEYRILYGEFHGEEECVYHIITLGSDEPKRIRMTMGSSEPVEQPLAREFLMHARGDRSVLVRGNLHWYLRHRDEGCKIMVFDTVSESFQWMRHPAVPGWVSLLEMDNTLVFSAVECMSRIDLWVLQDHERSIWACKHRIELPMVQIRQFPECNLEHLGWSAMIVSVEGDVLVRCSNRIFHCDRKGNVLASFQFDGQLPMNCLHRLKENLVLHPFFRM